MGWRFNRVSSYGNNFNYNAALTPTRYSAAGFVNSTGGYHESADGETRCH
jgi:hypothetical protein